MTPEDPHHPDHPTAAPRARNDGSGAAVGGPDEQVVARLRTALDELTTGAEPTADRTTPVADRPARRWMLPAVAAALVALAVGTAAVVVGGDDHATPGAPTPSGSPVPTAPPAGVATIPWYELDAPGAVADDPDQLITSAEWTSYVWAAPDYSRVLSASVANRMDADREPTDWPNPHPIPDPPAGAAWTFQGDEPSVWHGVYWAIDPSTAVVITGHGFSSDDLVGLLPALTIERSGGTTTVVSALSSLPPVPAGTTLYGAISTVPSVADSTVELFVADGPAVALAMYAGGATSIAPVSTPFGEGLRMEMTGEHGPLATRIWWQIDDGPYWAGLAAPTEQIDDLLGRLRRVPDIAAPASPRADEGGMIAPETTVPATVGGEPVTIDTAVMTTAVPVGDRAVVAVGESVMLSAARELTAAGIRIVAHEAIQAPDVAAQLEQLRDTNQLGDEVVVQVGTNGTVKDADLDRIMAALAGVERVVILTVHADRPWIPGNNELIRALPERYPNVRVVDWDQIASECGCLTGDGIHVEDAAVYADAVTAALA